MRNLKLGFSYKLGKSLGDSSTMVILGFFPVMKTLIPYSLILYFDIVGHKY